MKLDKIAIREINSADYEFIISMTERLLDFPLMKWRDRTKLLESQLNMAKESLQNMNEQDGYFVAVGEEDQLFGYLHMTTTTDHFTGEKQGYISSIFVSKEGEGKGIGKKLMEKAHEWTKDRELKQLVLHVFANNDRAIHFYEHFHFETEIVKMVKEL